MQGNKRVVELYSRTESRKKETKESEDDITTEKSEK